jgi:ACS family pantothenate transporter-like MFS transporter
LKGGAGPLILTWINEICTADTEKRALTVALANDLAYVVQAVVSVVPLFMIVFYKAKAKTGPKFCLENYGLSCSEERIPLVNYSAGFIK